MSYGSLLESRTKTEKLFIRLTFSIFVLGVKVLDQLFFWPCVVNVSLQSSSKNKQFDWLTTLIQLLSLISFCEIVHSNTRNTPAIHGLPVNINVNTNKTSKK